MRDVFDAVHFLHSNSIIHGDLKGANILVSASGRACIADLGISRLTAAAVLTWATIQSAPSLGTVPWQAPELLENCTLGKLIVTTTASDVYALGCLCYEVMPFVTPVRSGSRSKMIFLRYLPTANRFGK